VAKDTPTGAGEDRLRREFQAIIRRRRKQLQMSQEEFARALGERLGHAVSQSQISDWENGRFEPGVTVLLAMADMGDRSIDELRGGGPPAVIDRIDRIEDLVERLGWDADSDPPVGEELRRIGALLVQIIEALDEAGLWPAEGGKSARGRRADDGRA
jgi:transcriptional regulator with XRE-family HTH domain